LRLFNVLVILRDLIAFKLYHHKSPLLLSQALKGGYRKIAVLSFQIEYSIATSAQSDYYLQIKAV